jgi:hypothetical protein
VDVRAFTSLESLREQIVKIVDDYLKANPAVGDRPALKPFYFLSSDTVVVPTPFVAHNLREFIDELGKISVHSIHHHFIQARLRLKMVSNDFSLWLDKQLGLSKVAASLNRIDIYTSTLEDVRSQLIRILQTARA